MIRTTCLALWCAMGAGLATAPMDALAAEVQTGAPSVMGPFVKSSRSADELVAALDSPSLEARARADLELAHTSDTTLQSLIDRLSKPGLSPEQLTRLTRIAWERFEKSPRAALGISFQRGFVGGAESGAVIESTIPGFDSGRVLKPGDTIYSMGNVRIRSMDDGKRVIQSYDPGERVSLHVFRDGQPILVRVTLGSMSGLDTVAPGQPRPLEPKVVQDAFRMRLARDMSGMDGMNGKDTAGRRAHADLDLTSFWNGVETLDEARERQNPDPQRRPAGPPANGPDAKEPEHPTALSAGGVQGAISAAHFGRFAASTTALKNRIQELESTMARLDVQLMNQDRIIDDPNTGADRRDRAERDRKILLERRAKIKLELNDLQSGGLTH